MKEIVEHLRSLDVKYKGVQYTVSIGDRYTRLEVVDLVRYKDGNAIRKGCICKCNCGNLIGPTRLYMLLSKDLQSCGCYSKEVHSELLSEYNFKHGESVRGSRTPLYSLWAAMLDRCRNTNRWDAKYYSLKGITICKEWETFENFRDWAVSHGYEDGLSIERKDVNIGYCPENCTFIPVNEQPKNKSTSRIIEYNGERHNLSDWCRITGLSWYVLDSRLRSGISIGQALGFKEQ